MVTQSDIERERYESRLKAQRDWTSFTADFYDQGVEIGLAKGRTEGQAVGRTEGRAEGIAAMIQAFQRLLRHPETPTAELLALPVEELQARAQQLENALNALKQ